MKPEEARDALGEVTARQAQVRAELGRHRPPWSVTALLAVGYYVVTAPLDFAFPLPLLGFVLGGGLIAWSLMRVQRIAAESNVRAQRGVWSTRNIVITAALIIGTFVVYTAVRASLGLVIPDGLTSVFAAIPATGLFVFMTWWLWTNTYGRRQ